MIGTVVEELQDERALWSRRMDWAQHAMWISTAMIGLLSPGGAFLAKDASSIPSAIASVLWIGSFAAWSWTMVMFIRTSNKAKKATNASIDYMIEATAAMHAGLPIPPMPASLLGTHRSLCEVEGEGEEEKEKSQDA